MGRIHVVTLKPTAVDHTHSAGPYYWTGITDVSSAWTSPGYARDPEGGAHLYASKVLADGASSGNLEYNTGLSGASGSYGGFLSGLQVDAIAYCSQGKLVSGEDIRVGLLNVRLVNGAGQASTAATLELHGLPATNAVQKVGGGHTSRGWTVISLTDLVNNVVKAVAWTNWADPISGTSATTYIDEIKLTIYYQA